MSSQAVGLLGLARLQLRRWSEHRARTLLSLVGVAVGSALVVAVTALSGSVTGSIERSTAGLTGRAALEVSGVSDAGLDQALVPRVGATPGVAVAAPLVRATVRVGRVEALLLGADERAGRLAAGPLTSTSAGEVKRITDAMVAANAQVFMSPEGRRPVLLGERLAALAGAKPGDRIDVTVAGTRRPAIVAEILRGAAVSRLNEGVFLATDLTSGQILSGRPGKVDSVLVGVAPETEVDTVRSALGAAVGDQAVVASPQLRVEQAQRATAAISQGMLLSSSLAVGVGGFLVFTTMSMAALERRRELATLRALGGRRRTLLAAFLGEAAALGLVGSLLGCALGALIARPLLERVPLFVVAGFGVRIGFLLPPTAFPLGIAAGLGSTLIAAIGPGRRAVSVPPIESMRPDGVLESRADDAAVNPRPLLLGLAMVLGGIAAFTWAPGSVGMGGFFLLMLGLPTVLLGLQGPLVAAASWVAARFGPAGRLAAASLARAPRRAWVTSSAVLVATALVVGQGGVVSDVGRSLSEELADIRETDLIVDANPDGKVLSTTTLLPAEWKERIGGIPGVERVAATLYVHATRGSELLLLQGVEAGITDGSLPAVREDARAELLAGRGVALSSAYADEHDVERGDPFRIATPTGPLELPVLDIIDSFKSSSGLVVLALPVLQERFQRQGVSSYYVDLRPEASEPVVRGFLRFVTGSVPFPVGVVTGEQFHDAIEAAGEDSNSAFVAMQWVIVGASILAVLNAFLISVVERRREIGILRALGTGRRRIRNLVVVEAVAVGVVGGGLGCLIGLYVHAGAVGALARATRLPLDYHPTAVPLLRAVAVAVVVVLVGSIPPARRAAKVDVLDAIGYE